MTTTMVQQRFPLKFKVSLRGIRPIYDDENPIVFVKEQQHALMDDDQNKKIHVKYDGSCGDQNKSCFKKQIHISRPCKSQQPNVVNEHHTICSVAKKPPRVTKTQQHVMDDQMKKIKCALVKKPSPPFVQEKIVKKGEPCSFTRKRSSETSPVRPDVKKLRISSAQCLKKPPIVAKTQQHVMDNQMKKIKCALVKKPSRPVVQKKIVKKVEPCSFTRKRSSETSPVRPDVKKQRISSAQCLKNGKSTIDQLDKQRSCNDDDMSSNNNNHVEVHSVAAKPMAEILKVAKETLLRKRAEAAEQQQLKTRRDKERKALESMERAVEIDDNLIFRDLELFVHCGGVKIITLEQLGLRLKDDDED